MVIERKLVGVVGWLLFFVLISPFLLPLQAAPFVTLEPEKRVILPEEVKPLEFPINNVVVITGQGISFSESNTNRVILLDGNGNYLDETGGTGFGLDSFLDIADLSNGGFELWVNDPLNGQINRFDRWLSPLDPLKEYTENGLAKNLDRPASSARSGSGDILVLESDLSEILLLDNNLELIERIGKYGDMEINLVSPSRIEFSDKGLFAVADPGQKLAILFDRFGSFQKNIRWVSDGVGPSAIYFYDDFIFLSGEDGVGLYDLDGNEIQRWSSETFNGKVYDIAILRDKLIVASDSVQFYRIQVTR